MSHEIHFSQRTGWPLESNVISQTLDDLLSKNIPVINLTESNPTLCEFAYAQGPILNSFNDPANMEYHPSPQGLDQARAAIVQYYHDRQVEITADQVILTSSTSEAYSYLFRLLTNVNDTVLFPKPSYPLFSFLVDLNDVRMGSYNLYYDKVWRIDLKGLSRAVDKKTKAIVVVNPNNPTGSFVKADELSQINTICRDNGLAIISDEVFSDFAYLKDPDHVSLAGQKDVLTFVLSGISKILGLPQMKLSWIIVSGPDQLVIDAVKRLEVIADTYLSVSTPAQNALAGWFGHRDEIQSSIKIRLSNNLQFLRDALPVNSCELLHAEGGWYAVLKILLHYPEEELVMDLLVKDHVMVHPGYFYDFTEENFIVVSLLLPPKQFQDGIMRLFERVTRDRS